MRALRLLMAIITVTRARFMLNLGKKSCSKYCLLCSFYTGNSWNHTSDKAWNMIKCNIKTKTNHHLPDLLLIPSTCQFIFNSPNIKFNDYIFNWVLECTSRVNFLIHNHSRIYILLLWSEMPSGIEQQYSYIIMRTMVSQITSLTIVYSTVYSGADQRKHQSSASLAFLRGIHRWPVNSPHKGPVTRKLFPFDDVIMQKKYIMQICPPSKSG